MTANAGTAHSGLAQTSSQQLDPNNHVIFGLELVDVSRGALF